MKNLFIGILLTFYSIATFAQLPASVIEIRTSGQFKLKPFVTGTGAKANLKPIRLDSLLKATDNQISVAGLRALTGFTPFKSYLITDQGKEGVFKYDATDLSTIDNLGTVLVDGAGRRWKRVFDLKTVNALWFGVKNNGIDTYTEIENIHSYCVANSMDVFYPEGTYNLGQYSYPSKNYSLNPTFLLSMNNIKIYGDGRNTIFKTVSQNGADVFNLAAIKDITIENIAITAELLTGTNLHGSNGISIALGGENININNVYIYDLPFENLSSYIDGGKGVTIQPFNTLLPNKNISIKNIYVYNSVYGFGFDNFIENSNATETSVLIDGFIAEKCYNGISLSSVSPLTGTTSFRDINLVIDNFSTLNCQYDCLLTRWSGLKLNLKTNKNIAKSAHDFKNSTDLMVVGMYATMMKNSEINYSGDVFDVHNKLSIGGITSNASIDGSSENNVVRANIKAVTANTEMIVVNSGGATVDKSIFMLNNILPNVDLKTFGQNAIISNYESYSQKVVVKNDIRFLYSDNILELNKIKREGTAIAISQNGSSAPNTSVFEVRDNNNVVVAGIRNDGGLVIPNYSSSALGTYAKKIPVYDGAGVLLGYMPIYE